MSGATLAVIPARLGSTRLPRKPLHVIAGRPLLEWVWRRVSSLDVFDRVVIATDSTEVADVARSIGAEVEMTSPYHPSGTDRVAEVARSSRYRGYGVIVNVQGDEPFIDPEHLAAAIRLVRDEAWDVGTVAAPLDSLEDWRAPSVVKVIRAADGRALYFSRAPIPHVREREPSAADLAGGTFLRHIGVYAYQRHALQQWVDLEISELERFEKLEQLRPLAAGLRIGVAVSHGAPVGIDTLEDAQRAELRLRAE